MENYLAYLRVRRIDNNECVHSVGLSKLNDQHVERVMLGLLRNMDTDKFFIDESEVDSLLAEKDVNNG